MDVAEFKERHDHPSFFTAIWTVVSYGVILLAMTLLLFGLPWLIFSML